MHVFGYSSIGCRGSHGRPRGERNLEYRAECALRLVSAGESSRQTPINCRIPFDSERKGCPIGTPVHLVRQLYADRGYDADWIRELARQQGAWANIPPKRIAKTRCFSPYLYRRATRSNASSTRSNNVGVSPPDMTNSQPTIWCSSNSHQSEFG